MNTEIVTTDAVLGGKPRIAGRRISVLAVKDLFDTGRSPARIAADYDLDLAAVHTALAYYHDHPEEMRAWREHQAEIEQKLRKQEVADPDDLPAESRTDSPSPS